MLRRLSPVQPESFAFTEANLAWAYGQMTKFPEGRQASAIIPILWRAQEQEGWLSRPAIEYVANLLDQRRRPSSEPAALHLTRSSDLLQLELPTPDLSIYQKP